MLTPWSVNLWTFCVRSTCRICRVGGTEMTAEFDLETISRSDNRVREQPNRPWAILLRSCVSKWPYWLFLCVNIYKRMKYITWLCTIHFNRPFCFDLFAGKTHTLFFRSVRPEHAGEIRFTAERVSSYATLTVKGEQPSTIQHGFIKKTKFGDLQPAPPFFRAPSPNIASSKGENCYVSPPGSAGVPGVTA